MPLASECVTPRAVNITPLTVSIPIAVAKRVTLILSKMPHVCHPYTTPPLPRQQAFRTTILSQIKPLIGTSRAFSGLSSVQHENETQRKRLTMILSPQITTPRFLSPTRRHDQMGRSNLSVILQTIGCWQRTVGGNGAMWGPHGLPLMFTKKMAGALATASS